MCKVEQNINGLLQIQKNQNKSFEPTFISKQQEFKHVPIPIRADFLLLLNKHFKNCAVAGIRTQDARTKPEHGERCNQRPKVSIFYVWYFLYDPVYCTHPGFKFSLKLKKINKNPRNEHSMLCKVKKNINRLLQTQNNQKKSF